jgi:hypothetical protein
MQRAMQHWRSVGPMIISEAGGKETHYSSIIGENKET